MTLRSVIIGAGCYLPERVVTNAELAKMVDTTDEWIVQRTGIRERHIAADGEVTSGSRHQGGAGGTGQCRVEAQSIDLIVVATSTPDNTFPASAVTVQAGLGITGGAAFDLQAVCSGFVFGLATVDGLLRTGMFKRALLIGAETFSRILDWNDRTTCVLFGDGAGAVVIEAQEQPGDDERPRYSHEPSSFGRATQVQTLCRWRSRPRHRPSATSGWKGKKSSNTRFR